MSIDIAFDKIKSQLLQSGNSNIVNDLEELIAAGSTGGEIIALTSKYLIELKRNNKEVYELLKPAIAEYLRYS